MNIPKAIQEQLEDYGFNHAEPIEHNGKTFWFLSSIKKDGRPAPTGLPVIFQQLTDGRFYQLEGDDISKLLKELE